MAEVDWMERRIFLSLRLFRSSGAKARISHLGGSVSVNLKGVMALFFSRSILMG